jgi:hypothetical protein
VKRSVKRFAVMLLAVLIVLAVALTASAVAKPKVTLRAASSSCKVGHSVKVCATVAHGSSAYEVRIYKKVGSSWKKVVTATLIWPGHYHAYVKATAKGKMQLRAGYVNNSGSVTAWSNIVVVTVR